jgi:hypothetical protein
MESSPFGAVLVLLASLLSGGGDLLDAVPTDAYWARRGVEVTTDRMIDQLAPGAKSIDQDALLLRGDDPILREQAALRLVDVGPAAIEKVRPLTESKDAPTADAARLVVAAIQRRPKVSQVRRLMAIRALGELGDPRGLAAVEAAGRSGDPFAADYAARAAARIARRPVPVPQVPERLQDAWLLPATCRAVVQWRPAVEARPRWSAALAAAFPDADHRNDVFRPALNEIESLAEAIGNVRVQTITVGLSGDPAADRPTASALLMVRAQYDRAAVRDWVGRSFRPMRQVDKADVADFGPEMSLVLAGDDCLAMVATVDGRAEAINGLLTAVAAGKGGMADAEGPLGDWLRKADLRQPMWGVGFFTPADHAAGIPNGMQWVAMYARPAVADRDAAQPELPPGLEVHVLLAGQPIADIHAAADALSRAFVELKRAEVQQGAGTALELLRRLGGKLEVRKTATGAELVVTITPADLLSLLPSAAAVDE